MSAPPATVYVVLRQHKPGTPDVWEFMAVCHTEAIAAAVARAIVRDTWRDEDDVQWHAQRVLTEVPEGMRR